MALRRKRDHTAYWLLSVLAIIVAVGAIAFTFTLSWRFIDSEKVFWYRLVKHLVLGLGGGTLGFFLASRLPPSFWRRVAPYLYILSILLMLLVFVPGIGFEHGGARRWISLKFISFQPVEFAKLGLVLMVSAWLARSYKYIRNLKHFAIAFSFTVPFILILYFQRDTSSLVLTSSVALALIFLRGARWKHTLLTAFLGAVLIIALIFSKPYIYHRFDVYFHPDKDPLGAGYQIKQAKMTIGSGKFFGRGLGQSAQKYRATLPEPETDSIFAIFAEETGFLGSTLFILLYLLLAFFGIRTAKRARSLFEQTLAMGITLLIVTQSFLNIATISGIIPLSGFPLIFMSGGGTALLVSLTEMGILFAIARSLSRKRRISQQALKE